MMASNYVPGTWLGVVRSRTAVVLGPDTPPSLVQSIWELLETGPEIHDVLHTLTSGFGASLAQIPWFGIIDFQDSLRVFLRGDIDLTVQLPTGPVELNGRDVTTWTERWLSTPAWYSLTVPGDAPDGAKLPLGEGVVLLQGLTVAVTGRQTDPKDRVTPVSTGGGLTPKAAAAVFAAPAAVPSVTPSAVEPPSETADTAAAAAETPDGWDAPSPAMDAPEHGASAETVMGVHDDELDYAAGQLDQTDESDPVDPADSALPPSPGDQADLAHPLDGVSQPESGAVPANELTGNYDHLWEKTVMRSIEDAAVRVEPEDGSEHNPAGQPPATAEAGEAESGEVGSDSDASVSERTAGGVETPAVDASVAPEEDKAAAPAPGRPPASAGGLIDSVPWHTGGDDAGGPWTPPSNAPASNPSAPDWQGQPDHPFDDDGDHDGQTIMKSDLVGMAAHPAPVQESDLTGALVLGRVCGHGHANPPTSPQCASCGMPLPADAVQVPRPRLGRMRLSTGELIDLDQSMVIGRQPSVSRVQGGVMPRLVQVASPSGDISRSHVEVRLEGWHVMLCDLKATNGTVLVREGQQPRRLAQNEMAILLDGDIAELGDNISLRFEEIL